MRTDAELHNMIRDLQAYTRTSHESMFFWREIELILEALRIFINYGF